MDTSNPSSVLQALSRYRATVTKLNFRFLELLIDHTVSQPRPADFSPEFAEKRRLEVFDLYLGHGASKLVSTPSELLSENLRPSLIERFNLDGTMHLTLDHEARKAWFARVREGIDQAGVSINVFPPPELEMLCSLVSGVCGPGLPPHRRLGTDLLSVVKPTEKAVATRRRVVVPVRGRDESEDSEDSEDEGVQPTSGLDSAWEQWEIAVAVRIGDSETKADAGSWTVYCRRIGSTETMQWRYGLQDGEWTSDLFASVEDYLDYLAIHNAQTEVDVKQTVRSLASLR